MLIFLEPLPSANFLEPLPSANLGRSTKMSPALCLVALALIIPSKARKSSYISVAVPGAFLLLNYALKQSQSSGMYVCLISLLFEFLPGPVDDGTSERFCC